MRRSHTPTNLRPSLRSILLTVLLSSFTVGPAGCDSKSEPSGVVADTPAEQTYTVRGRVIAVPNPEINGSLEVHHEAIPTFVGKDGTVKGMKEMIMEFAWTAPGALPTDLTVGDAIEMVFEVRWKSQPRTLVTKLTKLAPDAPLDLQNVTSGD